MTEHVVPPAHDTSMCGVGGFDPEVWHQLEGEHACMPCAQEMRRRFRLAVTALNEAISAYERLSALAKALDSQPLKAALLDLRLAIDPDLYGLAIDPAEAEHQQEVMNR